jgi:hypothetical protein
MKISNLAPVISITSTLNSPEEETITFFFTIDNAIECLVDNPEEDNRKFLGLTEELNKLVGQFVDSIREAIS